MTSPRVKAAGEPLLHDKPIALRLTDSERERTFRHAQGEGRSASNFVRFIYLRGLAEYEREQQRLLQQRRPAA